MKGLYLAAIDIIVDGLDSIAHLGIHRNGSNSDCNSNSYLRCSRRSGNGAVKSEVLERRGKNGKS